MHTETIAVDNAQLEIYLLKESQEFQTGKSRPAIIICPGGAYLGTADREAEPVALWFAARGYQVFVLRYSTRVALPRPMIELAKAISLIRSKSKEWHIDPDDISICGFSAGGHLCSHYATHWQLDDWLDQAADDKQNRQPNAVILCYPLIDLHMINQQQVEIGQQEVDMRTMMLEYTLADNHQPDQISRWRNDLAVTKYTPRTFIWHTADDELVPALNSLRFAVALQEHNVSYELHIFEHGVHGLSLATSTSDEKGEFENADVAVWAELADRFLKRK